MYDHCSKDNNIESNVRRISLIGNPNVGKSAIFGLLTGRYVTVSNYPGTTVEMISGEATIQKEKFQVLDTPGVNSLIPMSEDEKVTRDTLINYRSDAVIQVIAAKNIKRGLYITLQLVEMGVPLVIDLNMKDEALRRGIVIEEAGLGNIFGVDVVSTVAVQKKGMTSLKNAALNPKVPDYKFSYDPVIEEYIAKIETVLPESNISKRSIALMILSGDRTLKQWLLENLPDEEIARIESFRDSAAEKYTQALSHIISQRRLKVVERIAETVVSRSFDEKKGVSKWLGDITVHPVWGFPFLFLVLFLLYEFVGVLGAGTLVNFLEKVVFGEYLNPWAEKIVMFAVPFEFLQELLIGPYGVFTMALTYAIAIILPITATFFIAFSIMEDSGYLPRLAAMLNRVFNIMGLNGKAVLPMVLGLGCDTMATLTTRILDTRKERLIVILLLALAVPCSAQLGVVLGMFGKQPFEALLVWLSSLVSIMLLVGFISSKIIPGKRVDFILELPPLRVPQFSNVLIKTVGRIEWYLKEAVPLFILGTLILFTADKLNLIILMRDLASPVIVGFLGLPVEATESFVIGFLRRDYGAAGLFALQERGLLNTEQVVVSLVTITLFVPCIANLFMIIKEKGLKVAMMISGFIFPFAILVGGALHRILLWSELFN